MRDFQVTCLIVTPVRGCNLVTSNPSEHLTPSMATPGSGCYLVTSNPSKHLTPLMVTPVMRGCYLVTSNPSEQLTPLMVTPVMRGCYLVTSNPSEQLTPLMVTPVRGDSHLTLLMVAPRGPITVPTCLLLTATRMTVWRDVSTLVGLSSSTSSANNSSK